MTMKFGDISTISGFSIETMDLTEIIKIGRELPKNKHLDGGIAEKYLLLTIEAQDMCQEKIAQVNRFIGIKKIFLDKEEATCALTKAKDAGHKTVKEKEWFSQTNETVLELKKELELAKVAKSWLEAKIKYFTMWHYSLKLFLTKDHEILLTNGKNTFMSPLEESDENVDWVNDN